MRLGIMEMVVNLKNWIPAGVYSRRRGRERPNDSSKSERKFKVRRFKIKIDCHPARVTSS